MKIPMFNEDIKLLELPFTKKGKTLEGEDQQFVCRHIKLEKVEMARAFLLCNQDYKCQQLKIKEIRLSSVLGNGYWDC